jgi:hypothetical protein
MMVLNFILRAIKNNGLFIIAALMVSCESGDRMFSAISPESSGVLFSNSIDEDKKVSILDYLYYYNGAGVGSGDLNNDGLNDLFFVSNTGENKLFINQGNLKFKDETEKAGIYPISSWNTGVSLIDINSDGWLDIYVSSVVGINGFIGHNELWLNNQDGTFSEKSKLYGLDLQYYGVSASFFDYDKDGDLDVYIVNHGLHPENNYERQRNLVLADELLSSNDRLLRNDNNVYTDVTLESGLVYGNIGYGLDSVIADFNHDGWDDIYVSNDFYEDDYYYVNQGNGKFIESLSDYFTHTSQFSMGLDFADLNGDSYPELFSLDMLPEDEMVLKTSLDDSSPQTLRRRRFLGYTDQFSRNHLHLNYQGESFRDIAHFSNVEASDWSWSCLFSDLDNDGFKDLHITNGILKRPNDADFIKYISSEEIRNTLNNTSIIDKEVLEYMPEGRTMDKLYRGQPNLRFKEVSNQWLRAIQPSSSSGLVHTDLDNDGDLELVINGTDESARIFKNNAQELFGNNFLKIQLTDVSNNVFGIGTKLYIYSANSLKYEQFFPFRGFGSSQPYEITVGLGTKSVDSILVVWPDGNKQIVEPRINELQTIQYSLNSESGFSLSEQSEFLEHGVELLDLVVQSTPYPEFDRERLLPLGITESTPVITVSDLNFDGIDDFYIGGTKGYAGSLWLSENNSWYKKNITSFTEDSVYEDSDAKFSDINRDGYLDILVASGGGEFREGSKQLEDRVYLNSGDNDFIRVPNNKYPRLNSSKIVEGDFNNDGFQDFFIGNRSVPGDYTVSGESYFYKNHNGVLEAITNFEIPNSFGKVTGGVAIDIDKDGLLDLILSLEWDKIRVFRNLGDFKFTEATEELLEGPKGLWQSISLYDIDKDGDQEIIAGNIGLNTRLETSRKNPLRIYWGDFNDDSRHETIVGVYKEGKYFPLESYDNLTAQIPELRKTYPSYNSFAGKDMETLITSFQSSSYDVIEIEEFRSGYFKNQGGKYSFFPFDADFQMGPLLVLQSFDDGNSFIYGGIKRDLPPIQGVWDSQPFIIGNDLNSYLKLNPRASRFSSNLKAIIVKEGKHKFILASIGDTLKIIHPNID